MPQTFQSLPFSDIRSLQLFDYGREVFAIPGRVSDIYSNGCNKLIKNGQATMLLSSKDVVDFYGTELKINKENKIKKRKGEEITREAKKSTKSWWPHRKQL